MRDDGGHRVRSGQSAQRQQETGVGNTPLLELRNITGWPEAGGAWLWCPHLSQDGAANPSGSFKAGRAALSVYQAQGGYTGVVTATSGNYGAAVASQAAMRGLRCIVVQGFTTAGNRSA